MRWIPSVKEAKGMGPRELRRAAEDGTVCTPLVPRVAGGEAAQRHGTRH